MPTFFGKFGILKLVRLTLIFSRGGVIRGTHPRICITSLKINWYSKGNMKEFKINVINTPMLRTLF